VRRGQTIRGRNDDDEKTENDVGIVHAQRITIMTYY
jgi:hypothetical protein